MNKKGITFIGVFFSLVAFWLIWIFFLAPMWNIFLAQIMSTGNITGFSALVLQNFNLLIGFCSILLLFWAAGSSQ
jgi:hypothetical protein